MTRETKEPLANITPFGLRMQPDLHAKVKRLASEEGISMNAAIVRIVEAHVNADGALPTLVNRLEAAIKALEEKA